MTKQNIIIMSNDQISIDILLESIKYKFNIISIISSKVKLGKNSIKFNVNKWCKENNCDFKVIDNISNDLKKYILEINPTYIIVYSFGFIIPSSFLEIKSIIFLNLHFSLLPKYRGASPVQSALYNGDKYTGVTLQLVFPELDSGDIIWSKKITIDINDNFLTLFRKLCKCFAENIKHIFDNYNLISPIQQDSQNASYCYKISSNDGLIRLNYSSSKIYNIFKAFYYWPGIYFIHRFNNKRINIKDMNIIKDFFISPPPHIKYDYKNQSCIHILKNVNIDKESIYYYSYIKKYGLIIKLINSDDALCITKIQIEGKKTMDIESCIRGNPWLIHKWYNYNENNQYNSHYTKQLLLNKKIKNEKLLNIINLIDSNMKNNLNLKNLQNILLKKISSNLYYDEYIVKKYHIEYIAYSSLKNILKNLNNMYNHNIYILNDIKILVSNLFEIHFINRARLKCILQEN